MEIKHITSKIKKKGFKVSHPCSKEAKNRSFLNNSWVGLKTDMAKMRHFQKFFWHNLKHF